MERVQLLFTCSGGQSNPLRLPEGPGVVVERVVGGGRLRRFREIRALTKRKKDIIPFVSVGLIPREV